MTKKTKLIIALFGIIILTGSILVALTMFSNKTDKVIAKVNGQKIYQSELDEKLSKMFQSKEQKIALEDIPEQVIEAFVQDIYLQKEIDKLAEKSPIAKDKNLQKQIEDYKKTTLRQAYIESLVNGKIDDQAIKNKYAEISGQYSGKKEMHIRHILLENEDEVKKVVELLAKKNSSFEKLAKEYSKDEANSGVGGDLGYVIADNLDEDFAKAVLELKIGQISSPIKTNFGWHIIKLEDSRSIEIPAFGSIKKQIENSLKQEAAEKVFSKITKDAKVKILINLKKPDQSLKNPPKSQEIKNPENPEQELPESKAEEKIENKEKDAAKK